MDKEDIKFIRNELRQISIRWRGRSECLRRARKKVFQRTSKEGEKIFKLYWQCNICKNWRRNAGDMEVDHIVEIGTFVDWNSYMEKLFCGQENLQAVCSNCHMKKTKAYNSAQTLWTRKKKIS